jgi:flagellar biosynthesis/type III secretory pathway protein FliH
MNQEYIEERLQRLVAEVLNQYDQGYAVDVEKQIKQLAAEFATE